jgi:ankyrin repeat protein
MSRIVQTCAASFACLCLLLLTSCGESPPKYYGIYAFDHGHYVELGDNTPEEKRLDFSPSVQILIFDKAVAMPNNDLAQITIKKRALVRYDIENVQDSQTRPIKTIAAASAVAFAVFPDLPKHFKPDENNKEMLYAVPDKPLDAGLYIISFNGKNYLFDVGLGATTEQQSNLSGCYDRYLKTEPMEGLRAFWLFGMGKQRSKSGNAVLEESYKPCSEWDAATRNASMISASIRGDWPQVRQLIEQGADPNALDRGGMTPLMHAILRSSGGDDTARSTVKFLLDHGALANVSTGNGQTPLDMAVMNASLTSLLLEHGARPNPTDELGMTPLERVACVGNSGQESASELIVHQANVNLADNGGDTPLHCAVSSGSISMVKLLLAHGAAVNVVDKLGETPLDKSIGHPDVSALLKANGATGDIPIQLPHLYEQLRKPAYKATFLALFMGETHIAPWLSGYIAALGGVEAPGRVVTVAGTQYEFYSACQPHNCYNNQMSVLFTRDAGQAWILSTENRSNYQFYGNPDEAKQTYLTAALAATAQ